MEDELRRRRRRERNKVAATKCRNKKKERTGMLVKEGEILETQNSSLKIEISRLEAEKRHLMDILALHESSCTKRPRKPTRPTAAVAAACPPPSHLPRPPRVLPSLSSTTGHSSLRRGLR